MSMSVEANKAAVDRLYTEFFGQGKISVGEELLADHYAHHSSLPATDKAGFLQVVQGTFTAFPDVSPTVEDMVAEGDRVAVRVTATGTHRGDFMGIPATQQAISWREQHIYRFENGRVVEHWAEMSLLEMMQQLGALPPMG